jgi:cystathionine gamma-synthase
MAGVTDSRNEPRPLSASTVLVSKGRPPHEPDAPLNHPVTLAATYVAGGDMEYGRYGNPVWAAFEEVLGELEGGRALVFSSGLAAIATVLDLVSPGEVVVAPRHAYLGTLHQLGELADGGRLTVRTVDIEDTDAVLAAAQGAALVWLESPTNPALEVADIEAICVGGHEAGAKVVVDNTFATPVLQRPLAMGADVVVHSATKFLAGHSDVVLGAVVTADPQAYTALDRKRRTLGAIAGPFETWLALRGMRTLHLRLERASANAAELAARLGQHPAVLRTRYPGLGAIVAIELTDADTADRLVASTRLWVNATSLGGVESTFERRRRWTGEPVTISEGLVRLSVGIEDVEDLWADLQQALDTL